MRKEPLPPPLPAAAAGVVLQRGAAPRSSSAAAPRSSSAAAQRSSSAAAPRSSYAAAPRSSSAAELEPGAATPQAGLPDFHFHPAQLAGGKRWAVPPFVAGRYVPTFEFGQRGWDSMSDANQLANNSVPATAPAGRRADAPGGAPGLPWLGGSDKLAAAPALQPFDRAAEAWSDDTFAALRAMRAGICAMSQATYAQSRPGTVALPATALAGRRADVSSGAPELLWCGGSDKLAAAPALQPFDRAAEARSDEAFAAIFASNDENFATSPAVYAQSRPVGAPDDQPAGTRAEGRTWSVVVAAGATTAVKRPLLAPKPPSVRGGPRVSKAADTPAKPQAKPGSPEVLSLASQARQQVVTAQQGNDSAGGGGGTRYIGRNGKPLPLTSSEHRARDDAAGASEMHTDDVEDDVDAGTSMDTEVAAAATVAPDMYAAAPD